MYSTGSVLQIGLNKDPRKIKFERAMLEAEGVVPPPQVKTFVPKVYGQGDGRAKEERHLSEGNNFWN
jgi:hypothetical protein